MNVVVWVLQVLLALALLLAGVTKASQPRQQPAGGSAGTTRSSSTAPTPPVWPASRCISSSSGTATGTFDASLAACRSGRRQGIGWKGRWWMLRATDPGPEETRRHRHARHDHHPVVRSVEPGEDCSWWVVDQVAFVLDTRD